MNSANEPKAMWTYDVHAHFYNPKKAGNYIAAFNSAYQLMLLDVLTGKPFIQSSLNNEDSALTLNGVKRVVDHFYIDGYLVVINQNTTSSAYDILAFELAAIINSQTADALWSETSIIPSNSNPSFIVNEGVLYGTYEHSAGGPFGAQHNYLLALEASSGKTAWIHESEKDEEAEKKKAEKDHTKNKLLLSKNNTTLEITLPSKSKVKTINTSSFLCANHEAVYMAVNSELYAFNKAYGDRRFPRSTMVNPPQNLPSISSVDPILNAEKYIIATEEKSADNHSRIYAFDPVYGEPKWSFPATEDSNTNLWKTVCLSEDKSMLLIYNESGQLQLLDTKSGLPMWVHKSKAPYYPQVPAIIDYDLKGIQAVFTFEYIQFVPQYRSQDKSNGTDYTWNTGSSIYKIKLGETKPGLDPLPLQEQTVSSVTPPPPILLLNGAVITASTIDPAPAIKTSVTATPVLEDRNAAYFVKGENSIAFSSIGDILNFGENKNSDAKNDEGNFTVECWIRTTVGGQIFESSTGSSSNTNSIRLNVSSKGVVALAITADSGDNYVAYTSDQLNVNDGEWHHIAVAVEANKGYFYVDGIHVSSNKIQTVTNLLKPNTHTRYYNDDYIIEKLASPINNVTHKVEQIHKGQAKPQPISISNQTAFSIGASSVSTDHSAVGFTGLLREFRIWNNALSAEKINSRMFKILGPYQNDSTTKTVTVPKQGGGTTTKEEPVAGNSIKGVEPKMVVNVHMDKSHTMIPNTFTNSGTAATNNVLNDVSKDNPLWGSFNYPCSCPTDIDLLLTGYPYILDHDHKEWPFEEHWAVRGEHAASTDVALSNDGVICFGANNYLYGVRKHDGKSLWNISMAEFSNPIATDMGFLVLASEDTDKGNLCLINTKDGFLQVIGKTTLGDDPNVLGSFSPDFQSNRLLAYSSNYLIYANDSGGVGIATNLSSLTTIAKHSAAADTAVVSNLKIVGNCGYWCETDTTSGAIYLRAYNLDTGDQLFSAITVTSTEYAVNKQHLFYITASDVVIADAQSGTVIKSRPFNQISSGLSSANFTGIAIAPSNNQLIITQKVTSITDNSIHAVRPVSLTKIWSETMTNEIVNTPVISGRNVYCTAQATAEIGAARTNKGSVVARDLSSGAKRGHFHVTNRIVSPPLVDHGTVYFACEDNKHSTGKIDGAIHQVVFGDTNVLQLDGSNYFSIKNGTTTTNETACWMDLNPLNACVEAWVNLNSANESGIISLTTGNAGIGLNLNMHVSADQSLHFSGFYFNGTDPVQPISFKSTLPNVIPLNKWCHIAVNTSNSGTTPIKQLFIDGKPTSIADVTVGTIPDPSSCPNKFLAYLGANGSFSNQATSPTNGLIGTVRIWNTYLTVSQIMDRMHTQLIGTEANLLADWSFNLFSAEDVAGNAIEEYGFEIKAEVSTPNYILNELNMDKPNYPYLTYKGAKYKGTVGSLYKYRLDVYAHKADGSPIDNQYINVWYSEGDDDDIYVSAVDHDKQGNYTQIPKKDKISDQVIPTTSSDNPTNGITIETTDTGLAKLYVLTTSKTSGPGFDLFSNIIPKHERFNVNTLIDSQELKVIPPPTIKAQGELVQDYHYSHGATINEHRQKGVYRTILRVDKPDKSPLINEMVMVYTDTPQTISVQGQVYSVTAKNGAALYTNELGEIMIDADATDTKGFNLEVWAGFMHKNERTKYAVSEGSHKRLAGIQQEDLNSHYVKAWTGAGSVQSGHKLLKPQYKSSSEKVAYSLRHLMASSNSNKSNDSNSNGQTLKNEVLLGNQELASAPYTQPTPKPNRRQPVGNPMPDSLSSLRTLTYINRTKTMDIQGLKKSVLDAAKKAGVTNDPTDPIQGFQINYVKPTSNNHNKYNSITTSYLKQSDIQSLKTKSASIASSGGAVEWFGSDLFDDIESVAEKAADAFEHLVKDAEAMVLDFTSDIETAITSVLNELPFGHVLADAIEKVMAVVDKVIQFVDILINTMLDFLMLLFEWKHILATQGILLGNIISPILNEVTTALGNPNLLPDVGGYLEKAFNSTTANANASALNTSKGELQAKHASPNYMSTAHGVKSKSLVHKTQTHSSNTRTNYSGSGTRQTVAVPSSIASVQASFGTLTDAFKNFDITGSFSPIIDMIQGGPNSPITEITSYSGGVTGLLDDILNAVLSALQTEFGTVNTILTDELEIPFISALYEFITETGGHKEKLSFLNLGGLVIAVPVLLVYEMWQATQGITTAPDKYFDHNQSSLSLSFPSLSNNDTANLLGGTSDSNDLDAPTKSTIEGVAIAYGVLSVFEGIFKSLATYQTYQALKLANGSDFQPKAYPSIGLFSGIAGIIDFGNTICRWGIDAYIDDAIEVNKTLFPSPNSDKNNAVEALKEYVKITGDITFWTSIISNVVGTIQSFYDWIEPDKLPTEPKAQSKFEIIKDVINLLFALANLTANLALDVVNIDDINTSTNNSKYGNTLVKRLELYYTGSIAQNIGDLLGSCSDGLETNATRDVYAILSGGEIALNGIGTIAIIIGELECGIYENETQLAKINPPSSGE